MNEQEELMDNLLNIDLEIIDNVRALQKENWVSETLNPTSYTTGAKAFLLSFEVSLELDA